VTSIPNNMSKDIHGALSTLPAILKGENVRFGEGAGKSLGMGLLGLGVLLALAGFGIGFSGALGTTLAHALGAYLVGTMAVLAVCIGATIFLMIFHLVNAGWTATLRRQFENIMSFLPFAWLMLLPLLILEIANDGVLFRWMHADFAGDYLLQKKSTYFFFPAGSDSNAFPAFFVIRYLAYGAFWFYVTSKLLKWSGEQDRTGSAEPSSKARFMCAWALPLMALSTAFVAFDFLMTLDFKFFSTMWGVYYFAGAAFASIATVSLICNFLLRKGKMRGLVTTEHFHDLGKLQFSFTVFWAYIAFSQYFLIWYANIPEETSFFLHRKEHGWKALGIFLIVGHFVAPFLIILSRHVKKNLGLMLVMSVWCLLAHIMDMFWIVRPMVYAGDAGPGPGAQGVVLDVVAILGCVLIFAGYLVQKVAGGQLVAVFDPFMHEGLEHKNYV